MELHIAAWKLCGGNSCHYTPHQRVNHKYVRSKPSASTHHNESRYNSFITGELLRQHDVEFVVYLHPASTCPI